MFKYQVQISISSYHTEWMGRETETVNTIGHHFPRWAPNNLFLGDKYKELHTRNKQVHIHTCAKIYHETYQHKRNCKFYNTV